MLRSLALASFLFTSGIACSDTTAYADQIQSPSTATQIALGVSPAKVRAPYDVQIIRDNGESLPTYPFRDRYYVQGNNGERYTIRIVNPTPRRIEAVVSVDGLDVIDGEAGDLRKRGYVVPAYGETHIEGFRTSQADVATFRFSSVNDSYAGKKGKARNVGVIAVALFEEQARPEETQQVIVGGNEGPRGHRYDYTDDLDAPAPHGGVAPTGRPAKNTADREDAKKYRQPSDDAPAAKAPVAPTTSRSAPPAPPPSGGAGRIYKDSADASAETVPPVEHSHRPGLGTEFGEQRYSAASFTRFVRAADRPVAVAELRYNDAPGLMALGINVQPLPDGREIMTRETADPFPGDPERFARPPGR
jgi:hypothetical protein